MAVSDDVSVDYIEMSKLAEDTLMDRARRMMGPDGDERNAIRYLTTIIGKCSEASDAKSTRLAIEACSAIGRILFEKELYAEAFRFMTKGVRMAEDKGIRKFLPELYKNIGNVYSVYGENDLAVKSYEKSLAEARALGDSKTELKTLCNLSGICVSIGRVDKARNYYDQMMRLGKGDSVVEYFGLLAGAMIADARDDLHMTVEGYKNAVRLAQDKGLEPKYVAAAYSEPANSFLNVGMTDSARYYYERNQDFCVKNNLIYEQRANLKALIGLYAKAGLASKASAIREKYYLLQDSLLAIDKYTRIKDSEIVNEMEKAYSQISTLSQETVRKEAKIRRQRTTMLVIAAFLLVFIAATIVVYLQKQRIARANRHLYRRQVDLIGKERQYEELLERYSELKRSLPEATRPDAAAQETVPDNDNNDEDAARESQPISIPEYQVEAITESIMRVMTQPEIFCSNNFSLARMAEITGHNSRYLSQVINDTFKKNFRTFVNEYRISEAAKRLADNERFGMLTIRSIGEDIGFKSYSNFIDTFKKITGMAPSEYRKIAITEAGA